MNGLITLWGKDYSALKDNLYKTLDMVDKLPKGVWKENLRMCLTNALKYLGKAREHGKGNDTHQPETHRVGTEKR